MSKQLATVVLIEDEPRIQEFVKAALEEAGYAVVAAATMAQGLTLAGNRKPDLILLDLGLPDGDGLQFIERFRQWSSVPILVLSARSREEEKICSLDLGADDYLTKPFGVGELMARVRAALRRRQPSSGPPATLRFGEHLVDFTARRVFRGDEPVHLTPIEFRLLAFLCQHAGRVVTHRQIMQEVWGPAHREDTHYLRIYMGHLRHKLEGNPSNPRHLMTEAGVGYRLVTVAGNGDEGADVGS